MAIFRIYLDFLFALHYVRLCILLYSVQDVIISIPSMFLNVAFNIIRVCGAMFIIFVNQ